MAYKVLKCTKCGKKTIHELIKTVPSVQYDCLVCQTRQVVKEVKA